MGTKKITLSELRNLVKQIINEEKEEKEELHKIDKKVAEKLFKNGMFIYIKTDKGPADSSRNLFALNNKTWDGSMNIYTAKQSPEEYGFDNIIEWIEERESFPLEFYTLYSKDSEIIEP